MADCAICLNSIDGASPGGCAFVVAHCGAQGSHVFHADCMWQWICSGNAGSQTACPTCRGAIGYSCYEGARFYVGVNDAQQPLG